VQPLSLERFEPETFPRNLRPKVSDSPSENDFERESSRLNEGLKTCRSVIDNYRAMIAGEHPHADNDDSAVSGYVSTTGSAISSYEGNSAIN
jgi:hypothetical protein